MTRSFPWLACALVAMSLPFVLPAAARGHGRDPQARAASANGWLTDLGAAKREAKKTGKPILAVLRCFD